MHKLVNNGKMGFTLVETLASVGILITFLTAALVSFTSTQNLSEGTQQQAGVLQSAKAKLEEIRAHNFHDVLTDYSSGGTPGNTFNIPNLNAMGNIVLTDVYNTWTQETASAWVTGARRDHVAVVFNNTMWVLGGVVGGVRSNEVWYSSDGAAWTLVTPTGAMWDGRSNHAAVVFDNKIWILGGWIPGVGESSEVWYTNDFDLSDGQTWYMATNQAWDNVGRRDHAAVVFDNKIWVLGGITETGSISNEIWYSEDGATWTLASNSAWTTGGRSFLAAVVFDNKIWVLGGSISSETDEIWYSSNGTNWTQVTPTGTMWSARTNHAALSYGGKIWVLGGTGGGNQIWYSSNGTNWTQVTPTGTMWSARYQHAALSYGGKIWVLGGSPGGNEVWWSYGPERMYQVDITVSWRQRNGRIVGEDNGGATGPPYPAEALNGILDPAEDDGIGDDGDGELDSPVHITGLLANRGYPSQIYLGRE